MLHIHHHSHNQQPTPPTYSITHISNPIITTNTHILYSTTHTSTTKIHHKHPPQIQHHPPTPSTTSTHMPNIIYPTTPSTTSTHMPNIIHPHAHHHLPGPLDSQKT
ncbi:hypothetical protein Pcinc_037154 [Petrolisthes cinctipes]|uniref:Uncharacterized protein n=1 Tax=Petrolisthes cinctipes TaxID=88211 RepID=A0AAE1EL89_PETCI|nr:hypothetical protein Pcinc_037154 [Petrolisthes cinctipes]